MNQNQLIISLKTIRFGGDLTIVFNSSLYSQNVNLTIAAYNSSSGAFSRISVVGLGNSDCRLQENIYGEYSLAVLINYDECGEDKDDNKNKVIIGIVVGVGGFIIIVIIVVGVIGMAVGYYGLRRRRAFLAKRFADWERRKINC